MTLSLFQGIYLVSAGSSIWSLLLILGLTPKPDSLVTHLRAISWFGLLLSYLMGSATVLQTNYEPSWSMLIASCSVSILLWITRCAEEAKNIKRHGIQKKGL